MIPKTTKLRHLPLASLLTLLSFFSGAICATFSIANNCGYTVWPGILSGAGTAAMATTGFSLDIGQLRALEVPSSWSGRVWGRTHCSTDPSSGRFSCVTGDCGSGKLDCSGSGAAPPATLVEFTLDGGGQLDFFDVSLVDGYNLPVLVAPQNGGNGGGNCTATGCIVDLNGICPSGLRVTLSDYGEQNVACRSACDAFGLPEYCCSGEYGNPNTCKPSDYSQFFKKACPRAYSYAFDDSTSIFTCPTGINYLITFCPSTGSQKAGEHNPKAASLPLINETMVFLGALNGGRPTRARPSAAAGGGGGAPPRRSCHAVAVVAAEFTFLKRSSVCFWRYVTLCICPASLSQHELGGPKSSFFAAWWRCLATRLPPPNGRFPELRFFLHN